MLAAVGSRPVAADANTAAAEAAFQKGVQLRTDGKWQAACEAFKQSQELDAQLGTAFNLAGCYQQIGKVVLAWALYSELAQRDTNAGRKARSAQLAAQLKPRLSWLRLETTAKVKDLAVTIDGEPATRLIGVDAPLDVGTHEVIVTAPEREPWRRAVAITAEGERKVVAIPALVASTGPAPAVRELPREQPAIGSRAAPPERSDSRRRLFASVTASLGMYSAPPGVSVSPAFTAGGGVAIGVQLASAFGVGAIVNGDVVVDQETFERVFAGVGGRVTRGRVGIQAGPGLSILTGAGETVMGIGGDVSATLAITGRVGVSIHVNLSSVAQPAGLMGNLTVLRTALGISYLR